MISESQIKKILQKVINEKDYGNIKNYMFFSNLEQMIKQAQELLDMDPMKIEQILQDGHDWADDHITTAKENLDQVFDFLKNEIESTNDNMVMESKKKNTPTNPKLWNSALAWAKSRYKVCPSAYCNGAAVKRYNSQGGKWKKK